LLLRLLILFIIFVLIEEVLLGRCRGRWHRLECWGLVLIILKGCWILLLHRRR
jgi:hypothetical protein